MPDYGLAVEYADLTGIRCTSGGVVLDAQPITTIPIHSVLWPFTGQTARGSKSINHDAMLDSIVKAAYLAAY